MIDKDFSHCCVDQLNQPVLVTDGYFYRKRNGMLLLTTFDTVCE